MGEPAAKEGDKIEATDIHNVVIETVPTPMPFLFLGTINGNLSKNVKVMGRPAATQGSTATNVPPHVPEGGPFLIPPSNRAVIVLGSFTVMINGKPAARNGDKALTCNEVPPSVPLGMVIALGTVLVG